MVKNFHRSFSSIEDQIDAFVVNFTNQGTMLGNEKRNTIKLFQLGDKTINIKSFQVPNIFNQIAYKYFRKSKARRSFEYAQKLLDMGIGTPQPIAYYEYSSFGLFTKSYYVSEHLQYDLTYRELIRDLNYPDHDKILRAFTKFTFKMHENNVHFLDHSPGNTLIKKVGDSYAFYLVDLNRMKFESLDFESRIKNFERLTIHESMVKVMSEEYSRLANRPFLEVFNLMWSLTEAYQQKFYKKRALKKRLKFWKKK